MGPYFMMTYQKPFIIAYNTFSQILNHPDKKDPSWTYTKAPKLRNTWRIEMDAKIRSPEFRWLSLHEVIFNVHLLKNNISFSGKTLSGILIKKLWFRSSHTYVNVLQICFLVGIWNYDFDELWTILFGSQKKVQGPTTHTNHNSWRFQLSMWFSGTIFCLVMKSVMPGF